MSLKAEITVEDPGWSAVADLAPRLQRALDCAAAMSGLSLTDGAEVSLLLCDDATIRELNRTWRGHDKATNVLSFPAVSTQPLATRPLLGDIAVAFETTRREAEQDGKSLPDHLSHLVVHGLLHLVGYDHETASEADAMEALERRILAELGIGDPYAGAELLGADAG